tara:strand:- start:1317 stop:1856 length:540 start_codon:yes stop_codon:yes gene_type:complete
VELSGGSGALKTIGRPICYNGYICELVYMKALPPIERLNELFSYDSHTGILTRKCDNKIFTSTGYDGYMRVYINRKGYRLHRIVWALHIGEDPYPYEIDHINRVRDDNRIDNLRKVTTQDNQKNKSLYVTNKSGYAGVCKRGNRYRAQLERNKNRYYLGTFDSALEAHNAIITHEAYNS